MGQATSFYTDRDMVLSFLYLFFFFLLFLTLTSLSRILRSIFIGDGKLQFLVAHIKKAIADVESGNPVAFATGKVQVYSAKNYSL